MTFYESLAPYYDQIFPANDAAIQFLSSYFEPGQTILDIGAGTGNMAIALAQREIKIMAMEPDESMAEYVLEKSKTNALNISVHKKGMQELESINETVDGIYCIGNTLPHLKDLEEAELFLKKCAELTKKGGALVLQLVNYEKVLSSVEEFTFPIIETSSLTFSRQYEQEGEKILFTTNLMVDGKSFIHTIPLFPFTVHQLLPILNKAGFEVEEVYGNFKRQQYIDNSPALIIVAKR